MNRHEPTERGADGVSGLGEGRGYHSRVAREDRDGRARYSLHKATDDIRKQGGTVEFYFTPDKFRGEFLFAPRLKRSVFYVRRKSVHL